MTETNVPENSMFHRADDEQIFTSKLNFNNFELKWKIENFDFICANIKEIESPRFPDKNLNKGQWFLRLEPKELNETNNEIFKVELKNANGVKNYVNVIITFFDNNSKIFQRCVLNNVRHKASFFLSQDNKLLWNLSTSSLYSKFNKIIPKEIQVTCQLSVFDSGISVIEKPLVDDSPKCNEDLVGNMDYFYNDIKSKDVIFTIGRKKFTAHKAILALRSPVFASMFKKSKYKDEVISIVKIIDIAPTVFEKVINFIYTDKVEHIRENSMDLYVAAKKFQLKKLQSMCVSSLQKTLSLETIIDILKFANSHSILNLKNECLRRLITDLVLVKDTEAFKKFGQEFPCLLKNIIESTIIKKDDEECTQKLNLTFREKKT